MPATAGRVKMPHNNRVHTSSTLNTHSVWKDIVKYDPYGGDAGGGGSEVCTVQCCLYFLDRARFNWPAVSLPSPCVTYDIYRRTRIPCLSNRRA